MVGWLNTGELNNSTSAALRRVRPANTFPAALLYFGSTAAICAIVRPLHSFFKLPCPQLNAPNITAITQISNGKVEDLKGSLTKMSEEYTANKSKYDKIIDELTKKIENLSKVSATSVASASETDLESIQKNIYELQKIITDYRTQSSSNVTTVEQEMNQIRQEMKESSESLKQMTEEEIAALKKSLTNQIAGNTTLTEQQKKEIEEEISKLNTETVSNLDDANLVLP